MTRPTPTRRDWAVIACVNAIWVFGYASWLSRWPGPVRIAIVAAAVCIAPGAAWDWLWPCRSRALGAAVSRVLITSTIVLLLVLAGFRLVRAEPAQTTTWITMALLSNAGLLTGWRLRRSLAWPRSITRRELALAGIVLAGVLVSTSLVATRVVPPLPDHDLETQGTGFSLLTRLEPRLLTDRGLRYYFAHPPLLHLYVAASFLYQGSISALQVYDTLTPAAGAEIDASAVSAIDAAFVSDPHLRETRTPNVGIAAMTAALLLLWAFRRSRRWWLSALVVLAYVSSPEVVVRSAYGGYFGLSTLAALLMVLSVKGRQRGHAGAGLAAWALWVNHKLIVVVAGVLLGCVAGARHMRAGLRRGAALAGGAAAGTALFWVYGVLIAPGDFITDHLGHHLWQRLTHVNPLGYGGYPSVSHLWREFIAHTGFVLLPAGLLLAAIDLGGQRHRNTQTVSESWVLVGWILVTAATFSVVDWRMTKHLLPMVLALHMLLTPTRHAVSWRVAAAAASCLWLVAWNIPALAGLLHDFAGFTITPAW